MRHSLAFAFVLASSLLRAQESEPESKDPPLGPAPTAEQTQWLKDNAHALAGLETGKGFDDFKPLTELFADARVFGIGVGSPGTHEFARLTLRLLEYLVEQKDVSIVAIDSNMMETRALDEYVQGKPGDAAKLIGDIGGWKFKTQEFREMVEWLRRFNLAQQEKQSDKRVHLWGIDMQAGEMALAHALAVMTKHDPTGLKEHADAFKKLKGFKPQRRGANATALSVTVPVDAVKGKTVKVRGKIKTQDLEGRTAGLWFRVEGSAPLFENMSNLGPKGTADWADYEISVDVPATAEKATFGVWMPDYGTAWFDGLVLEVDGKPWSSKDVDLDFESSALKGVRHVDMNGRPATGGFSCALDPAQAAVGKQSVRLQRLVDEKARLEIGEMREAASNIVDYFEVERDKLVDSLGEKDADWAVQTARIVQQWVGMANAGPGQRALAMAGNLSYVLEHAGEAKVAVLAPNLVVGMEPPLFGAVLKEKYDREYRCIAMCCSNGDYAASNDSNERGVYKWATPEKGSIESILASDGRPMLLLDLHLAEEKDAKSGWLYERRPFGGTVSNLFDDDPYVRLRIADFYDALIWVKDTKPTKPADAKK